jgi:hypothetical protein
VRARRLPVAAHAVDAADPADVQRGAARALQEGAAPHQHGARRPDRRGGTGRGHRKRSQIGGAALDVFEQEPTKDHTLQQLPKVVASPHIAASTREGQELVGVETASALRDFLKSGVIRNAVNFPTVPADEFQRLQPYMALGERLGGLVGQMGEARIESLGVRYYGELAGQQPLIVNAVLVGLFRAILSDPVTR